MLSYEKTSYKEIVMIANVFRENAINVVYGESGVGKTISTIKALNKDNITPILFDFDGNDSPESNSVKFVHIEGKKAIKDNDLKLPTDRVIVVDTWALYIVNEGTFEWLQELTKLGNTVIIIAHAKDIATRRDIIDMEEIYANHVSAKLFIGMEREVSTGKDKTPEVPTLTIKKCRGYKGPTKIYNWMRPRSKDIITKELNDAKKALRLAVKDSESSGEIDRLEELVNALNHELDML